MRITFDIFTYLSLQHEKTLQYLRITHPRISHEDWSRFRYQYLKKEGIGALKQVALTEKRKEIFFKADADGTITCDWVLWSGEGFRGSDPPYNKMKVPDLNMQEEMEWF